MTRKQGNCYDDSHQLQRCWINSGPIFVIKSNVKCIYCISNQFINMCKVKISYISASAVLIQYFYPNVKGKCDDVLFWFSVTLDRIINHLIINEIRSTAKYFYVYAQTLDVGRWRTAVIRKLRMTTKSAEKLC